MLPSMNARRSNLIAPTKLSCVRRERVPELLKLIENSRVPPTGEESRVEGLEADADDYIVKPRRASTFSGRNARNALPMAVEYS
jgi:hypothetical protein